MKLTDRVGHRYEKLVVVERARNKSQTDTNARWLCQCDCGKNVIAYGMDLQRGKVKSCGCFNAERIRKHGFSRTRVYNVWRQMHQRCVNPRSPSYKNYGARGIRVCKQWKSFEAFIADMGDRPRGYTLERRDNDKGYSKGNCYWATMKAQSVNKRTNRIVEFRGKRQTLSQWAEELGVSWSNLRQRARLGWSVEKMLTTPVKSRKSRPS